MKIREHLPLAEAPESVWAAIELGLDSAMEMSKDRSPASRRRFGLAAAAAVCLAAGICWYSVENRSARGWIQTGAAGRTTLRIGDIGSVELAPNTRVRVLDDRPDLHRLRLTQGTIYARITAPPRLFFVETKAGTAIDLGCEYSLNVDEDGSGLLRVTRGWVEFRWAGIESLVPAGARCRISPGAGPDVPYFEDAPPRFVFGDLDSKLATARVRDTLTLWHLLSRVAPGDRERVYDRIASLTPPPADLSKERALALDPEVLNHLKDELAWKW
jgi:ferric-dicitrate binding protein FerR (iron transport regulator)